jgi:hypothetical protein
MSFVTEMPRSEKSVESASPPAYIMQHACSAPQSSQGLPRKTKLLFGYSVAVTTILIVVLILGGIFYFRSQEVLQDTIKMYHSTDKTGTTPVDQDIEVNTAKNTLVFHLNGEGIEPGTFAVLDYSKSMTGVYDPRDRTCYLIGGIQKRILDPMTFNDMLAKNATTPSTVEVLQYQIADTYPINDKAILPSALKSACAYLPVYWLEPAVEPKPETKGIQKRRPRFCWRVCVFGFCYQRCR